METAKLFKNGKSQAIRLPKAYRFDGDLVYIKRVGKTVTLLPYSAPWDSVIASLGLFSPDFMSEHFQPPLQERGD